MRSTLSHPLTRETGSPPVFDRAASEVVKTRMRVFCAAAVCSVLFLTPAPARADLVTFQFDGVLTSVPLDLAGDFAIGDAFSYTLGLDTTTMFGNEYVSTWRDFGGTVGDYAFSGIGGGRFWALPAFPDRITGELHDYSPWLISGGNVGAVGQFAPLAAFSTWLFAPGTLAPVINGVLPIPTSATLELLFGYQPDPVGSPLLWANGPTLTLTASSISMASEERTSVPEPSTLALMGLAIGVSSLRRTLFRRVRRPDVTLSTVEPRSMS